LGGLFGSLFERPGRSTRGARQFRTGKAVTILTN
jgi:hypothetical protein